MFIKTGNMYPYLKFECRIQNKDVNYVCVYLCYVFSTFNITLEDTCYDSFMINNLIFKIYIYIFWKNNLDT